ncbi:MAG: sulfite exporter TauE/SafE family protein [Bacillota bacterium]|nr:sulfite exporter TauE/SafE family protein [Bacillota bacterium]
MAPLPFVLTIFAASVAAGLLGSLLGLGGGIIVVPTLTLLLGIDLKFATGASIVSVIATSSGAAAAYVRDRITNMRVGMFLEVATTSGALVGAFLVGIVAPRFLYLLFALMLGWSAVNMVGRRRVEIPEPASPDRFSRRLSLAGSYYDAALERQIQYRAGAIPFGFGISFIAGLVSGLLGIGGGVLKVVAMESGMRLPLKVSTATSNFMIGVTAAASAGVYFARGQINPLIAAPVALGVLTGATLGARVMTRIRSRTLRFIFVPVLLYTALQMLGRGLGVYIP